jgi:RNA polymerase sigma-70 factor (ECF subfamily)
MERADSDFELLSRWRAGDRLAGARLCDRHFSALYRFFRNKVEAEASDLVQRCFLACVESRDAFRGEASFRTYLFQIARLQLYMHFRKRGRELRDRTFRSLSVAQLGPSHESRIDAGGDERLLLEGLRRIPVDLQMILELHYWEDMPIEALAQVFGIPPGTAKSRLFRARKRLAEAMAELGAQPGRGPDEGDLERWAASIRVRLGPPAKAIR